MLRRTLDSYLIAAQMDPERRDLFVEGDQDRILFKWLTRGQSCPECRILNISTVEIVESIQGGDKEKLLFFATFVHNKASNLRFFVDLDFDSFLDREYSDNVWTTDFNDLESYLINEFSIRKSLMLGLHQDSIDPVKLLDQALNLSAEVGYIRIYSKLKRKKLSINTTRISRYLKKNKANIIFKYDDYLKAILQNSNLSLSTFSRYKLGIEKLKKKYSDYEIIRLIRGKDVLEVLTKLLKLKGVNSAEFPSILWASFDESNLSSYDNLLKVVNYIRGN